MYAEGVQFGSICLSIMTSLQRILGLALFLLASCSAGETEESAPASSSEELGSLSLIVTDAPLDHAMVEESLIRIDKVRIHDDAADDDSGFDVLYDGEPIEMDLVALRNGLTELLVRADLPAGDYRQLRLHVSSARLELVNGNVYTTEDGSLKLSSQGTSGFKVFLDPPVHVSSGLNSEVLLDFDLSKTFKPIPANDPMNANSFRLHPVIRVSNLTESGEFRGIVFVDDGQGGLIGLENASVYVMPPGESDTDLSVASTASNADGTYAILGVSPGTYDVLAKKDVLGGRVNDVTVSAGNVSLVDIIVQ